MVRGWVQNSPSTRLRSYESRALADKRVGGSELLIISYSGCEGGDGEYCTQPRTLLKGIRGIIAVICWTIFPSGQGI